MAVAVVEESVVDLRLVEVSSDELLPLQAINDKETAEKKREFLSVKVFKLAILA